MPKKPEFIDKQELKRRIKDGNKERIKKGEMAAPGEMFARPDPHGAHFTKKQRKQFVQLVELAIYELATFQMREWYHAIHEITHVMALANFQRSVVVHTLKSIEHAAVQANGDKNTYARAAQFLHQVRTRTISIPGQDPGHANNKEAAANDPNDNDDAQIKTRGRDERPAGNGDSRPGKGRLH